MVWVWVVELPRLQLADGGKSEMRGEALELLVELILGGTVAVGCPQCLDATLLVDEETAW